MTRDELTTRLQERLAAEGGEDFVVHDEEGPLDTRAISVRALAGLYPGANQRTALLDGDAAFGATFELGLEAFLARRQVSAAMLPPEQVLAIYRLTDRDGALIVDADVPVTRVADEAGVVIHFATLDPMSGESDAYALTVPDDGASTLERVVEAAAQVIPMTRAIGLEHALASGDAMAMMAAVRQLAPPIDAHERGLLARVAAMPNEAIGYEAITRIDGSDAGADALRDATANDEPARARVVAWARSAHGEGFAARVSDGP